MSDRLEDIGNELEAAGVTNDKIEKMLKGDEGAELSAEDYMHVIELTLSALEQTNDVLDDNMRDIDAARNKATGSKGLYFSNLLHDSLKEYYLFMTVANCKLEEYTIKGLNSLMKVFFEEYTEEDIRRMAAETFRIYNDAHEDIDISMTSSPAKVEALATFINKQRYDIVGELIKAAEYYDKEDIINNINAIISVISMMMSIVTIEGHTNLFAQGYLHLLQRLHQKLNDAFPDSVAPENINNLKAAQMRFGDK